MVRKKFSLATDVLAAKNRRIEPVYPVHKNGDSLLILSLLASKTLGKKGNIALVELADSVEVRFARGATRVNRPSDTKTLRQAKSRRGVPELAIGGCHWPDIAKTQAIAVSIRIDVGMQFEERNHFLDKFIDLSLIGTRNKAGIVCRRTSLSIAS